MSDRCRWRIDAYLARDPVTWTGLDPGCLRSEVLAAYQFLEGEGHSRLGVKQVEYRYHALLHPAFGHPVFFFFDQDRLRCISTDFWSLDPAACQTLLPKLGTPPHRLSAFFRERQIALAEWVFAERGLALCVMPETELIARLKVFPSCTLEAFQDQYYDTLLFSEFTRYQ